jgi:NTP pyrophosphatase (non-canonical NTP hydrolase)
VNDKTVAELGDSVFSLLCMANEMDVDVEEVLRTTLDTYSKRWRRDGGFSA